MSDEPRRLGPRTRRQLGKATGIRAASVSTASAFEIAALHRARRHLERERAGPLAERLSALLRTGRPPGEPRDRLMVKSGDRVAFFHVDQVIWAEADGNYVRIHTAASLATK